ILRGCAGISREAGDEAVGVAQRIEIVGIAVMAQVPDRQDVVPALRGQKRIDQREVVIAITLVDERPRNAFAGDRDAERRKQAVILVGMLIMLELGIEVAALVLFAPQEARTSNPDRKNVGKMLSRACIPAVRASAGFVAF